MVIPEEFLEYFKHFDCKRLLPYFRMLFKKPVFVLLDWLKSCLDSWNSADVCTIRITMPWTSTRRAKILLHIRMLARRLMASTVASVPRFWSDNLRWPRTNQRVQTRWNIETNIFLSFYIYWYFCHLQKDVNFTSDDYRTWWEKWEMWPLFLVLDRKFC